MITTTRSLVRQFRALVRRLGIHHDQSPLSYPLAFVAGQDGLRIQAHSYRAALEYFQAGDHSPEEILLPLSALDDLEDRKSEEVTLEPQADGRVTAQWRGANIPQLLQYAAQSRPKGVSFPARPDKTAANEAGLLRALADANEVTERDPGRYAVDHIQLRGKNGSISASNGRQLLIQMGYSFPWEGDLLVPGSQVFASRDLACDGPVVVGQSGQWFSLAAGPWTLWLLLNEEGRFPTVDDLVRPADTASNRCRFAPADADFLLLALAELPTDEAMGHSLTIDLNGQVVIRGKAATDAQPMELVLGSSELSGEPRSYNTNREYLARALKLGLREFHFFGTTPIQAQDDRRAFIWMPLDPADAIPPSPNAIRIESRPASAAAATPPKKERRKKHVTKPQTTDDDKKPAAEAANGKPRRVRGGPQTVSCLSPIEQAKALRESLRDALGKNNELIRTLKRQQRQSKAVAQTLASLKELQSLSA